LLRQLTQYLSLLNPFHQLSDKSLIGLELDNDRIKFVQIKQTVTPFCLENYLIQMIPGTLMIKDEIKDINGIAQEISQLFHDRQITGADIALAIPRALAVIKTITIDKRLTESDIESRAWIEANRHFPDLVGNIYLDYFINGESSQDSNQWELILVACRKDNIKPHQDCITQAGFNPQIVDINCYALERALRYLVDKQYPDIKTIALLNINIQLSTLVVLHQGVLIHAHDQSYDGLRLFNQTRNYVQEKQAQSQVALELDLINDPGYQDILKESLISHLRHTMHFFYSGKPNITIDKLMLAGDCATIHSLAQFIEREINIPTEVANPFVGMTFASEVDQATLLKQAPALMMCCGLSMSNVE
jgi:type IV pilus assembly protein PilM